MPTLMMMPELMNYFKNTHIMTKSEKNQIKETLAVFCERTGSQQKAANKLNKVSSATISQVLNNNWELIANEMWRWIGSQIGWDPNSWKTVETRAFARITKLLTDAKQYSNVIPLIGDSGSGKSQSIKFFKANNTNTYHLVCNDYWNRKTFLIELLTEMGMNPDGYTVVEMMSELIRNLKKQQLPLLIIDEADKLSDNVLYFFITLYNHLEDHCGIVLAATDYFEKRIRRGLRLNKKGYKEIYSRLGSKFIPIMKANNTDVANICQANGISVTKDVKIVINDAIEHSYDLRRVKRKIHALKQR